MNTVKANLGSSSGTAESLGKVAHTPGPWRVGKTRAKGQEVCIDTSAPDPHLKYSQWEGMAVAYGCDEQPVVGAQVAMANARLIAAAPELLEALKEITPQGQIGEDSESRRWFAKARAAIAKATSA